jgi:hypothetical protein
MSLKDKYRINELVSFGSKALRKEKDGTVLIKKKDGKEVAPKKLTTPERLLVKEPSLHKKSKISNIPVDVNEKQESFSGEISDRVERAKYNEEELIKAIDTDVDELIKKGDKALPKVISKKAFKRLQELFKQAREELGRTQTELREQIAISTSLETQLNAANERASSAIAQQTVLQRELEAANERYASLLIDFQNALSKGIQEGVERVSIEGQLRGLQAEKETLKEVVASYQDQLKTAQDQIATLNQNIIQLQTEVSQAQRDAIKANQAASTAASKKGGKIICNELYQQGYLPAEIWDADERWGEKRFVTDPKLVVGYQMWARKVVKFMRRNPQWTPTIYFLCKPWTEWMAYDIGVLPKNNLRGQFTQWAGRYFSYWVFDMYGGKRLLDKYNYKLFKESWQ